ncbi:MAG: hypothetical protein QM809_07105 [Gordonia sp. (in: high G+C Gram-positive bacteria)]|uniref:hypothetical protein n=1 Tax=Gordonia sp. (in: high G+C Gram-positive bacteria) TaxID=84139 RepID=UPI0039E70B8E
MTYGQRADPSRINHPVATAVGVLVMIAVIVVGIVLWTRGSAQAVRIGDTRLASPVPVEAKGARVTASPIEVAVSTESTDPRTAVSLKIEVLRSVTIESCSAAVFPEVPVEASYTAPLPVDQATALPSVATSSVPLHHEVPARGRTQMAFTVGPATQSAGRVVVSVVRPVVVLNDGAELGVQSIALATTPEIVQAYIDGVHALDPTARQEQDRCAETELAKIDDIMNTSSMENEPLRDLRRVYSVLAGGEG